MECAGEVVVTWAVVPDFARRSSQVTLIGERGKLEILIANDNTNDNWVCISSPSDHELDPAMWGADLPGAAIDQLAAALAAENIAANERSTWQAATRAMELVDAVQLSLHRGRTVEILHQQLTEQLAFRGVMSAFGCGLLLLGMLVLVLVGVLGDTLGISLFGWWPFGLGLLLLLFLLLQLVPHTRRR